MMNLAAAIAEDPEVLAASQELFGTGLKVIVWAYGAEMPSIKDAPFLWIYAEHVENEDVDADQIFSVGMIVAAALQGERGEKLISREIKKRSAESNGLVVNGSEKCEAFRDFLAARIREHYRPGAALRRIRRQEDDLSHFPLSWSEMFAEYVEFETV